VCISAECLRSARRRCDRSRVRRHGPITALRGFRSPAPNGGADRSAPVASAYRPRVCPKCDAVVLREVAVQLAPVISRTPLGSLESTAASCRIRPSARGRRASLPRWTAHATDRARGQDRPSAHSRSFVVTRALNSERVADTSYEHLSSDRTPGPEVLRHPSDSNRRDPKLRTSHNVLA
jgi:hypothetical protein